MALGTQIMGLHAPPAQVSLAEQATSVQPKLSALQVRKVLPLHCFSPALQILSRQVPDLQIWFLAAQSWTMLKEVPVASQARRMLALHDLKFGTQTNGLQVPPLQTSSAPQPCSVQPKLSKLQVFAVLPAHALVPASHTLATQPPFWHACLVAAQS